MQHAYAERYGDYAQWHWWFRGRERILTSVLDRALRARPGCLLAALGCGPAEGLRWLVPVVGAGGRIVGVDRDAIHARGGNGSVACVVGAVEALPLARGVFDVVVALDVLEHLDDDASALREATGLLRRNGLLVVTVPASPRLWGGQDIVNQHRRRYTRATLLATFARAGLPPPAVTYFNTLLWPAIASMRLARRTLGHADAARSDFEDNRPGLANDLLAGVFALERHLIGRVPLPFGVSLLAVTHRNGSP